MAFLNRVSVSYILDWIIIVVFLAIAGAFSFLEPFKRDFSVTDQSISFPYRKDTISIPVLFLIAVLAPAAIIAAICLTLIRIPNRPGPEPSRKAVWKRKLWELHASFLGLALSLTLSLTLTQTMKNMFGKHRPDFLARCNPDVQNLDKFLVGGYTSELLEGTSQLVNWHICISQNGLGPGGHSEFIDGFRSFPSGHCTGLKNSLFFRCPHKSLTRILVAFAGLTYLSLFLAAKFAATVPFLQPTSHESLSTSAASQERKTGAAPPLYLLVIVLIPIGAAIYVASTRFTDGKHAGFDVLFGSLEGLVCAFLAFRWYHLPVRRGAGWAWAPRHRNVAFGNRMDVASYGRHAHSKGKQSVDTARRVDIGREIELHNIEPVTTAQGSWESQRALV
jgi:membrane-associated phospholipid phosphatase